MGGIKISSYYWQSSWQIPIEQGQIITKTLRQSGWLSRPLIQAVRQKPLKNSNKAVICSHKLNQLSGVIQTFLLAADFGLPGSAPPLLYQIVPAERHPETWISIRKLNLKRNVNFQVWRQSKKFMLRLLKRSLEKIPRNKADSTYKADEESNKNKLFHSDAEGKAAVLFCFLIFFL